MNYSKTISLNYGFFMLTQEEHVPNKKFLVNTLLRNGDLRNITNAMEAIKNSFLIKTRIIGGPTSREKYKDQIERMQNAVDRIKVLNQELKTGTTKDPKEIVKELEGLHSIILKSIAELYEETNDSNKKEVLLQNIVPLVSASSYAISQIKRQIAANELDDLTEVESRSFKK